MEVINFSIIENKILKIFSENNGNVNFEKINESLEINEKTVLSAIESLISKNIIVLDKQTKTYKYATRVEGEIVVLNGNIFLPATIIKLDDKMIVGRGEWYEFPVDFDIRRIIWNVRLPNKTNSSLVELIQSSVNKERKAKIVQLPEYQQLCNKVVPYSESISLLINIVGETITDITMLFKIQIDNDGIIIEHKGFSVKTEISTEELISVLKTPANERDYTKIKLNRMFNFTDFIFSKNEIPIKYDKDKKQLIYLKITGIRNGFEFTNFTLTKSGQTIKNNVVSYDTKEGIEYLKEIFISLPAHILSSNNINLDTDE